MKAFWTLLSAAGIKSLEVAPRQPRRIGIWQMKKLDIKTLKSVNGGTSKRGHGHGHGHGHSHHGHGGKKSGKC